MRKCATRHLGKDDLVRGSVCTLKNQRKAGRGKTSPIKRLRIMGGVRKSTVRDGTRGSFCGEGIKREVEEGAVLLERVDSGVLAAPEKERNR